MLIARAPVRISLAGGGTDLPAYYEKFGGLVVSTTIDKYIYVVVGPNGPDSVQITSADYQTFYRHRHSTPMSWNGELALPRAVLHDFNIEQGVSVFLASEVPPGTGLGSSGAVAAALIRAIAAYSRRSLSRGDIAELACQIEIDKLQAPVGKQDQYAAAFGGLNSYSFSSAGVDVEPVRTPPGTIERLERRLLLFFTGTARNSSSILSEQRRSTRDGNATTIDALQQIKATASECRRCLEAGDVDGVGRLLDEGWHQKKRLATGVSNTWLDEVYGVAMARGATGGKITGAGGGGFLLLYCHEQYQDDVTTALEQMALRRMDFRFAHGGVAVSSLQWEEDDTAYPSIVRRETALV